MAGLALSRRSIIAVPRPSSGKQVLICVIAVLQSLCGMVVLAGETSEETCLAAILSGRHSAISFEPVYTGELFNNARGGITTNDATQYQALLDLGLSLDIDETNLPIPGKFSLLAQNTHGRGLSEDFVGDTQVLSNIDSFDNIMQVSEYWWEFDLFDANCTVRLGKQDLNTEFLFIETAADFIESTFGLSPSTAFPTYPDPSMGAVVLLQLTEAWRLKTGVWDAFATGGSWGFSGNDSVLVAGELECSYALAGGSLPGVFAIGAVYESAGTIDGERVSPVHEYVIQFEQTVYRECVCDPNERQGLTVFAGFYPRFPGDKIVDESVGDSFVAGLTYTGLLRGRDKDVMGVGVAYSELFRGGTNRETVTELFYQARVTRRMMVQPDLQYIASPSGIYRDAVVAGVRFQWAL